MKYFPLTSEVALRLDCGDAQLDHEFERAEILDELQHLAVHLRDQRSVRLADRAAAHRGTEGRRRGGEAARAERAEESGSRISTRNTKGAAPRRVTLRL